MPRPAMPQSLYLPQATSGAKYARRDGLLANHQPETPRLIEGNLPLLPSEQESTLCRGIRKPIGELAAQTDALRYPAEYWQDLHSKS